ncbi:MAG: hypothetical protein ABIV10_09705 [Gemmatimonadaceae bacterium]
MTAHIAAADGEHAPDRSTGRTPTPGAATPAVAPATPPGMRPPDSAHDATPWIPTTTAPLAREPGALDEVPE